MFKDTPAHLLLGCLVASVAACATTPKPRKRVILLPARTVGTSAGAGDLVDRAIRQRVAKERRDLWILPAKKTRLAAAKDKACSQSEATARKRCALKISRALGGDLGIDLAIGHLASLSLLQLGIYDVKKGTLIVKEEESVDAKERDLGQAAAALVSKFLWRGSPPLPAKRALSATHWYQRWWVWSAAAIVVGAAIVLPIVLSRPSRDPALVNPYPDAIDIPLP
ncbi:MAG: hypothetical protein KAI47_28065 [Deltaproteobacteria bacterium]|nr:hypothetical protein [Deltaproteobacteria bacterium]